MVRINSKRKINNMKSKNYFKYILSIVTIILLNVSGKVYSQNIDKLYEKIDLFSEVLEKIQNEYVEEIDQAETMDAAINGLLQSLDPYSGYMSPEIFKESQIFFENLPSTIPHFRCQSRNMGRN